MRLGGPLPADRSPSVEVFEIPWMTEERVFGSVMRQKITGKAKAWTALLLCCAAGAGLPGSARADGDVAAGKIIAEQGVRPGHPVCASCHMADGSGQAIGGIPRLAGLPASYLEKQLGYFASGVRANVFMKEFAAALTPEQRANVAAYYASLPAPAYDSSIAPAPALVSQGEALYKKGKPAQRVMACAGCHGPTGAGLGKMFPALAGQSQAYMIEQLSIWHTGAKRDPDSALMLMEAKSLTPDEIRALAAYIHTLGFAAAKPQ
ncbi:c-type cytochrome [Acidomonas methanolica]|nr:c-type cytochrome [Acidomonas methanolica]